MRLPFPRQTAGMLVTAAAFLCLVTSVASAGEPSSAATSRLLYVASPGIRNDLSYGGHGLLVFDIDHGHKFVKRIPTAGLDEQGVPINVKGICASAATRRVYISTIRQLMCLDLVNEKLLWEKTIEGGCDRMSISPDGKLIYLPSLEGPFWNVVDAASGDIIAKIEPNSGAHNTVYGPSGDFAYLAGLRSQLLTVADARRHTVAKTVGPFGGSIRPFTIDGRERFCFATVNGLLGFEIGDLASGKLLHRVEVSGFKQGPVKRHGCPSHGIGLTPDEKELWVCDATNRRLHVFDATVMPPRQKTSIEVRDEPGWISFGLDGTLAYPSTGDVVDIATHKIIAQLTDEQGRGVASEKLLEIDFADGLPVRSGDQFGVGGVVSPAK